MPKQASKTGGKAAPIAAAARWHLMDADGAVLGRLSTRAATLLAGKQRPDWAPHRDPGDHVVVVNAERIRLTGKKLQQKMYRRHSGKPGGLKEVAAGEMLRRHPERLIEIAVAGMLPKNRLGRRLIRRLKVYRGPEHPHQAQNPIPIGTDS
jgi:large subunit ribosomal protein L13